MVLVITINGHATEEENTGLHDGVINWKHFPRYWPLFRGIHWSPVDSPPKGQWHGGLMFSLICGWINGWANNWIYPNFISLADEVREWKVVSPHTLLNVIIHPAQTSVNLWKNPRRCVSEQCNLYIRRWFVTCTVWTITQTQMLFYRPSDPEIQTPMIIQWHKIILRYDIQEDSRKE